MMKPCLYTYYRIKVWEMLSHRPFKYGHGTLEILLNIDTGTQECLQALIPLLKMAMGHNHFCLKHDAEHIFHPFSKKPYLFLSVHLLVKKWLHLK